ncbi:MAG: HD domain-containing protein [Pirellulaceae bacterium]|nr:HD domain-containing protein [Pirellulaceae bacterium]
MDADGHWGNGKLLWDLPELVRPDQLLRVPPEQDVPITNRVRTVLDTPAMQRLRHISQLGLVAYVYPGAVHTRLEHSLGVYRLACQVLRHLGQAQPELLSSISASDIKLFLLAALLHDVGHWPYCHPIEDMRLADVPGHEQAARYWITQGILAETIERDWSVDPQGVADFLSQPAMDGRRRLLQHILNGPVDIDKMDYLQRDSLHAGVPYGRNFDVARLLSSLRLDAEHGLTITGKGKTAAEMMVFSRYVMFSEVYWHHGVRSATAMLQRLVFRLRGQLPVIAWRAMSDAEFQAALLNCCQKHAELEPLARGLFGQQRRLYKRCGQYSYSSHPQVHRALAHRPFEELVACSQRLSQRLSRHLNIGIGSDQLLIDAPPSKLEIQFRLNVQTGNQTQPLADLSPVVHTLATEQFDKHVKQVRIFVAPDVRDKLQISPTELTELLLESASAIQCKA